MTKVEAVARALCPSAWHETEYPDGKRFTLVLWEEEQARARKSARAAIAAMREPTDAMREACEDSMGDSIYDFETTWHKAIDAALNEE